MEFNFQKIIILKIFVVDKKTTRKKVLEYHFLLKKIKNRREGGRVCKSDSTIEPKSPPEKSPRDKSPPEKNPRDKCPSEISPP